MTLTFILKRNNLTARFYADGQSNYRSTGFQVDKDYWNKNKRAKDNPAANNLITDWGNKFADYLYHCNKHSLTPNVDAAIDVVCGSRKLSGFTFHDAVTAFIDSVNSTHKAGTIKKYEALKELPDFTLDKLQNNLYQKLSGKLLHDGNANYTIKRKLGFVSTVLLYAKRNGMVANLPEQNEVMLKSSDSARYPLEENELAILKAVNDKCVVLDAFLFSCETGLRLSDVSAITPVCVIKDGSYINFSMVKGGTKRPNLPLSDYALTILNKYKTGLQTPYFAGLPFDVNARLKDIFRDAGLTRLCEVTRNYGSETRTEVKKLCDIAHFHLGRHSAASILIERGQPVIYVKELLGHSKLETTMKYVRVKNQVAMDSLRQGLNKTINY